MTRSIEKRCQEPFLPASAVVQTGVEKTVPDTFFLLHRLIVTTRCLLRSTWVATGMAVAVGMFVATLLVVILADVAFPLWPLLRFLGFLAIVVSTAWMLLIGVLRPLCCRLTDVTVARRIEAAIPGIRNRLVSCVDLAQQDAGPVLSPAFHRRLVAETFERVQHFSMRRVLDMERIRRAGLFAAVSVALMVLSLAVFSNRLPTAIARVLQPFADIPPVSGVAFDVLVGERSEPGDCEVLRGEEVLFTLVIKKGKVNPLGMPGSLRLEVRSVDEKGRSKNLRYAFPEVQDRRATFTLAGMQQSFTYRVRGGRTWTQRYRVTMLDRPRIVGLRTVLHYPAYMTTLDPLPGPPQVADIQGPAGSTVELFVDVEGHAAQGEIERLQPSSDGASQHGLTVTERLPLQRLEEPAMAGASEAETWTGRFPLQRDGFFRVVFKNRLGHPSQPMQEGQITAIPDLPPQISIDRPWRDLVVSAPVKVPLFVTAYDDFGIQELVLFTRGEKSDDAVPHPVRTYEIPLRRASAVVTLDLGAERLRAGEELRYWLQARDAKGQEVKSNEHGVRITDSSEAADRQFAGFREETEALQEKLVRLVDTQAAIRKSVDQMHEPRSLLRGELSQAAIQQNENLEFARQVAEELTQITDRSRSVPWLPEEIVNHLQSADRAFEPLALNPMRGLKELMERAAQPDQEHSQLPTIQRHLDLLQKNLEELRDRMQTLLRAQRHDWEEMGQALTDLERDLFQQNADLVARELAELRDYIDAMREDLQHLEGTQEELIEEAEQALSDRAFERFLEEQSQLDAEAAERLTETRELLNSDQLQELRDL
ncbi:MAG: hypothetical protein ACC628_20750, partial [Pirellulaceae bacterium]